jgi:hypothetical protein
VDCCGNDLVVCEPLAVHLGGICRPEDDPCAPVAKLVKGAPGKPATRADDGRNKGCWERLSEGVFAVDLYLRYHEDLGQGQRPLLGGRCGHDAGCEYGRVLERPCVHAEPAELPTQATPDDDREAADKARLKAVLEEIEEALKKGARGVRDYVRRHPPARFCFLDDLLCCLIDAEKTSNKAEIDAVLTRLRFWLFYDWFLQQLECDCWSCRPDTGVPLARLYLRRTGDVNATCSVLYIDYSAPYRRPIARDECAPPPRLDGPDLRRYYWLTREQAAEALRREGIGMANEDISEAAAFTLLSSGHRVAARGQRTLQAQFVRDPTGVARVAAFSYAP